MTGSYSNDAPKPVNTCQVVSYDMCILVRIKCLFLDWHPISERRQEPKCLWHSSLNQYCFKGTVQQHFTLLLSPNWSLRIEFLSLLGVVLQKYYSISSFQFLRTVPSYRTAWIPIMLFAHTIAFQPLTGHRKLLSVHRNGPIILQEQTSFNMTPQQQKEKTCFTCTEETPNRPATGL